MSNELAVGIVGVMVILAQAVPILWGIYRDKKMEKIPVIPVAPGNPGNPGNSVKITAGGGELCRKHDREIGELIQCVNAIKKMREEDQEDRKDFRKEVKGDIREIFNKIDTFLKGVQ